MCVGARAYHVCVVRKLVYVGLQSVYKRSLLSYFLPVTASGVPLWIELSPGQSQSPRRCSMAAPKLSPSAEGSTRHFCVRMCAPGVECRWGQRAAEGCVHVACSLTPSRLT